jgi:hypothetical protein
MIDTSKPMNWLIRADQPFKGHAQSFLTAEGKVAYTKGLTPDEYAAERGFPVRVITDAEMDKLIEDHAASMITDPERITYERYWDYLECLPPSKFGVTRGVEMFHVSERITHDLVTWCGKVNGKYFACTDQARVDRETLAAKFAAAAGVKVTA